mgnify:CR=1 FL=1
MRQLYRLVSIFITINYLALATPVEAGDAKSADLVRGGEPCNMCDLRYEDFSSLSLDNISLRGAYLFNAKFERASLIGANLESASIVLGNLKRVDLSKAMLAKANLQKASMFGATLRGASSCSKASSFFHPRYTSQHRQ